MSRGSARQSSSRVSCCSKNSPRLNCSMPSRSCGGGGSSQDIFTLSRGPIILVRGGDPCRRCSAHTPRNGSRLSLADASHASVSRARVLAWPQALYLSRDDRETAIEDSWMGRLRNRTDSEEHTHHRLRGREDLEPGEPPARAPLYRARSHLVLQAHEPYRHRRGRRRQRRALQQSLLPAQLLHPHRRRYNLDSRRASHSNGRG